MTPFEDRLARTVASVLGLALLGAPISACNGGGGGTDTDTGATDTDIPTDDLLGMCDGGPAPTANYFLRDGFVEITPGGSCPEAEVVQLSINACDFDVWQSITCGFTRVDRDQVLVDNGYGGYYADAATAPSDTGMYEVGPVVDVCYYQGVYWDDPNQSTTCGRPILRDGEAVVAPPMVGRSGWAGAIHPVVATLGTEQRRQVGKYWLECAVLEHASVASFSLFSLDLMRFGAPPDLLVGAHQAALDEIQHARLCFALASGYAGQPMAPGALPAIPLSNGSLADVAEALVREGCIGETLAAVDAAARLAVARDSAVRAALTVIVKDESAHAALAWRALRWILDQDHDGAIRTRLDAVFADERARWTGPREGGDAISEALLAHGLLPEQSRNRELRRAWTDVIEPSWAALVG